jgi:hypothetical protein
MLIPEAQPYTWSDGDGGYVIWRKVEDDDTWLSAGEVVERLTELEAALQFYAEHDNWLDHAEEVMEPEGPHGDDPPSWVAEVQLPGYALLDIDNDGWMVAEAALAKAR